jgi:hypothetical protein
LSAEEATLANEILQVQPDYQIDPKSGKLNEIQQILIQAMNGIVYGSQEGLADLKSQILLKSEEQANAPTKKKKKSNLVRLGRNFAPNLTKPFWT